LNSPDLLKERTDWPLSDWALAERRAEQAIQSQQAGGRGWPGLGCVPWLAGRAACPTTINTRRPQPRARGVWLLFLGRSAFELGGAPRSAPHGKLLSAYHHPTAPSTLVAGLVAAAVLAEKTVLSERAIAHRRMGVAAERAKTSIAMHLVRSPFAAFNTHRNDAFTPSHTKRALTNKLHK
jgi:hypothetical protein